MNPKIEAARTEVVFTPDSFYLDVPEASADGQGPDRLHRKWKRDFSKDRYDALFRLGFTDRPAGESASFQWLHSLSAEFTKQLTRLPELELAREDAKVEPDEEVLQRLLYSVPFGIGSEHVTGSWITSAFERLNGAFSREIAGFEGSVSLFLTERSQSLRVPERIFFHLVENEKDDEYPFAFIATYATTDSAGKVRHMPLSYALTEYKNQREKLVGLLSCLNKASEVSELIGRFVESGELFHPLRFSTQEAYEFLKKIQEIEKTGILCRVPDWWKRQYAAPALSVNMGEKKPSLMGFESIVSMVPSLTLDGTKLTQADIEYLLAQTEGLARLKGKWVEVDHAKLKALLKEMEKYKGDLTLLQALRIQTGVEEQPDLDIGPLITNGKWLGSLLTKLRQPSTMREAKVPSSVQATLRPYQKTGYTWLNYMSELGFGACLADDMGLGKTLQVLTFLMHLYKENPEGRVLLIVPASLMGNWEKENLKFTPSLPYCILHGGGAAALDQKVRTEPVFLTITTYGMAARVKALEDITWDALILDEAQAIKNPGTKQTRSIKKLKARQKIAMTGTPIENDLTNLWSLFDFLNHGLLGSSVEFREFTKQLESNTQGYSKLKNMVSPFILRRVKTDKSIIADLPEKLEQIDYVSMSKKQIVLYRKYVSDLESALAKVDGMQRRGIVLAALTKLKQICNHPDQYLGQDRYAPEESGKFVMLRDICETIYEKRERVLVFTQYREITEQLSRYLSSIFGRKGFVLHGGTRIQTRTRMVEEFNDPETYIPYMILSVKAGGTGLNLTAANHVIHFDRWWNPAVENQATDRAYRIGQEKNVMVHKLVSEGTIEEKIDTLINSKKELAENVIGSGGENWITELGDREILDLMRLEL